MSITPAHDCKELRTHMHTAHSGRSQGWTELGTTELRLQFELRSIGHFHRWLGAPLLDHARRELQQRAVSQHVRARASMLAAKATLASGKCRSRPWFSRPWLSGAPSGCRGTPSILRTMIGSAERPPRANEHHAKGSQTHPRPPLPQICGIDFRLLQRYAKRWQGW